MPREDSCPISKLVVWDVFSFLPGAKSKTEKGRSDIWDGDGHKWRIIRFSFYGPFTVVFLLDCKFHEKVPPPPILTYLKHLEYLAHNRLSTNTPSAWSPYSALGSSTEWWFRSPSWRLTLVMWHMVQALIPWLGWYDGCGDLSCAFCMRWAFYLRQSVTVGIPVKMGAGARPAGDSLISDTGFMLLSALGLLPQVAPCWSRQSAASSYFSATVSPLWLAGSACSVGPASLPGMLWMWSPWSCIPPTRGWFFPGLLSGTCVVFT